MVINLHSSRVSSQHSCFAETRKRGRYLSRPDIGRAFRLYEITKLFENLRFLCPGDGSALIDDETRHAIDSKPVGLKVICVDAFNSFIARKKFAHCPTIKASLCGERHQNFVFSNIGTIMKIGSEY